MIGSTVSFTANAIGATKNAMWVTGCQSWYLDNRGVPITRPLSVPGFEKSMTKVERGDYEFSGA